MQAEHAHTGRDRTNGTNSARLGGARADFVAGLGRKVADLRTMIVRVRATPAELPVRDELRRKLHALDSAAKMMKFDAMDRALAEALGTLDRSSRESELDETDLDMIEQIVEDLPALAWGDGRARSSLADAAEKSVPRYDVLVVGSSLIADALLDDPEPTPAHPVSGRALAFRYDAPPPVPRACFVCQSTPDAQAAYDIVRTTEPHLVVLDADLPQAAELVETLMDDPLTEAVPIVVVGSFLETGEAARYVAMGVAKTVSKPTSREALRETCEETLNPGRSAAQAHAMLGDPTLEELGDRLAAEIRDAIVGRADPAARSRRIPLGQGTEVLGAVWGAIARVREVVTARSDGTVRFFNGPDGAFTPAPLLHEPDVARGDRARTTKRGAAAEVRLNGRRVVVADDDPGVVWFLADLLKTAGCVVHEAFDGQQALELAYKTSPDLVISDILMPNLDGFSLCRALRRDVALRDTPVILLSWKEDLLQRVRELGAGAAGYVRKESDTRAIIARVREALRARGRIEARLREDGEVRGRLDGVSIRSLLEVVCATRPEARVSVRDATFLYEVEIRWGAPHRAIRTDGEGAFLKGARVLTQLLGVSAGRFTVTTSDSPIDAELDGNLAAQLAKPIARARAATMLLTGVHTSTVARVHFDDEALDDYLKATPERAQVVARRLANGAPPRELVTCGGCEPALLDDLLCELAARGIVTGIDGIDGEDMLAPQVSALLQHTDARAAFAPRTATPSPVPALAGALDDGSCASPDAPFCMSPEPGAASSLEDAVLREVIHRSPEPSEIALAPFPTEPPALVDPKDLKPRTSPPPPACEEIYGTPTVDQILALAEPTIVDDTVYAELSNRPGSVLEPTPSVPVEAGLPAFESSDPAPAAITANDDPAGEHALPEPTPFVTVTHDEPKAAAVAAPKRKKWPMVAFVAACGVVGWAVLHFSTNPVGLPKAQQKQLPPEAATALPPPATGPISENAAAQDKADEVFYTAADTGLPAGHGVLDVSSPVGAALVVDGTVRARVPASLPIKSGNHDVRVKKAETADERGCTIDVRSSRVAHVRF